MKKYIYLFDMLFLVTVAMTSCSKNDESFVLRSDNTINLSSSGNSKVFTICTDGEWSITTASSWLKIDKASGKGNGITREVIKVGAERNISVERTDSFFVHAAGKDLKVLVNQAMGRPFTMSVPSFSQALQSGVDANGVCIKVPYNYGYAGMKATFVVSLSGEGAEGLTVAPYTTTLETEKGIIEIPISGTPSSKGDITITINTDLDNVTPVTLTTVVSGRILIEQHFDLCVWGSDIVANKPGVKGGYMETPEGRVIDPSVPVKETNTTDDGGADFFSVFAPSFLASRGMTGWSGLEVHEHPGYVKMGTGKVNGYITTPALGFTPKSGVISVTCRAAQYWGTSNSSLAIKVNEGTPSITTYKYQHDGTKTGQVWETVSFTVSGVTSDTKITFTTENATRFCIDDIVVCE